MKKINQLKSFLFLLPAILLAGAIFSCKKDNNNNNNNKLSITYLSATSGALGTTVVIYGTGFDLRPTYDAVFFNGKPARVVNADLSQLTVTVPAGAGTGPVTVKVAAQTAPGPVFTYIVTATVTSYAGNRLDGDGDGAGNFAAIASPMGITVDSSENVLVVEQNGMIRLINPQTKVSHFSNSLGESASNRGSTVDNTGNFYFPDNDDILKTTTAQAVTVFAGSRGQPGNTNGPAADARFNFPSGVVTDSKGNFYITDVSNYLIRKISPDGNITTYAGTGHPGNIDGPANTATFYIVNSPALDKNGNLYISDDNGIRKITTDGTVSTFAGDVFQYGSTDGIGTNARFYAPAGIAIDNAGNLYVSDLFNNTIRKITPAGVVTTIAGNGLAGYNDGIGKAATFNRPRGITIDKYGNLFVADYGNNLIRKITLE